MARQRASGEAKQDIGKSQAEKGNVSEPQQATAVGRITAEPFLTQKKQSHHRAGNDSSQRRYPTCQQIPFCN